jgi:hypothetical protein
VRPGWPADVDNPGGCGQLRRQEAFEVDVDVVEVEDEEFEPVVDEDLSLDDVLFSAGLLVVEPPLPDARLSVR